MRRPAKRSSPRLSADCQRLINFSQAIADSAGRLEEQAWGRSLDALLHKQLKNNHQDVIDTALDYLFKSDLMAYEMLIAGVEANSEACTLEHEGQFYSVQLLVLPVLAWTRFTIASGNLPADIRNGLFAHLHAHILADDVQLALAPALYAIEQLPRYHTDIFALAQRMGLAAIKNSQPQLSLEQAPTTPFLADTRYLLAAIAVPVGAPLFRWQMDQLTSALHEKADAFKAWTTQATPLLNRFLPGCNIELLLPQPYYFACREADKNIRPAAIRAADHYLTQSLGVSSSALRANIGSFCEDVHEQVDEYRIGISVGNDDSIVYGIVWPLYEQEDGDDMQDASDNAPIAAILGALRDCGIIHVKLHDERYTMEFCEDCGAPLFPDSDGDLVHAEMPAPATTEHLH